MMLSSRGHVVPYKTLIIVESPSKCKTIEHILGPSYMCVATCGHIRDLAIQPDLSNVSEMLSSERIPYTKSSKKMAHIRTIQNALSKCNGTVILATDADREGESIAWHVCQVFGLPVETTPRIVFKEITQTAIRNALDAPVRINMNLVRAQQTRQILDFIIGYGVTPLLWTWLKTSPLPPENKKTKTNTKTKLVQSAGRCQSPALRIMQEAYNDMRGNLELKSNNVDYKCVGYFTKYNIPFIMTTRLKPDNDIDAFLHFYTDSDKRMQVANAHRFDLSQPKLVSYKPPPPLKSTTLQQLGSICLGLTPAETMDAAQRLYEAGYITYHRTDSTFLSEEFKTSAYAFIETIWNASYTLSVTAGSSTSISTSGSASDHAHEAIRPVNILVTKLLPEPESNSNGCFGKTEQLLYSLIWTRAVSSCMCDSSYEKVTATISSSGSYVYRYNAYRQKMAGWRACVARYGMKGVSNTIHHDDDNHDSNDDSDNPQRSSESDYFTYLHSIAPGSSLPYNSIECYPVLTNAFVPYTYAKLIHRLEKIGIGRPSTFASIVHTLKKREYICEIRNDDDTMPSTQTQDTSVYHKYKITTHGTITDTATLKKNKHYTKNQIQITSHGQTVINALFPKCESLFAYDYTREMEETLDRIAKGNTYWVDVCKKCMAQVEQLKQESASTSLSGTGSGSGSGIGTGTGTITGVIRHINEHASIRDGKFGSAYIYFRTPAMKKPKFIALKGFPYDYMKCDAALLLDWIDRF
jgi:DNA topoisomerase-1